MSWFRNLFCSCIPLYSGPPTRELTISNPTNPIRHDLLLPGISPEQQTRLREKSRQDAQRMIRSLQPLRSSPSGQFAERGDPSTFFVHVLAGDNSLPSAPRQRRRSSAAEKVRAHTRQISDGFKKVHGYQAVGTDDEGVVHGEAEK